MESVQKLSDDVKIYYPRKRKWIGILLTCAVFVAVGFLMLSRSSTSNDHAFGIAGIAFFGLGSVVAVIQLIPNSSFLRIDRNGLAVRGLWRTTHIPWSEVDRFGVAEYTITTGALPRKQRMVGYNYSESASNRDKFNTLKAFNRNLTGFEAALPDTYGWDCAELADHLNVLHKQYCDDYIRDQ